MRTWAAPDEPQTCPRCGCEVLPMRDGERWVCPHCGSLITPALAPAPLAALRLPVPAWGSVKHEHGSTWLHAAGWRATVAAASLGKGEAS